ncbi:MAG TPA: hypothetical protein VHB69_09470 [Mycobacteriales bacterium]|nr:hypothetical protein [Mycobacteriales bacterium]
MRHLAVANPLAERYRQADELADVLSMVDAMPPSARHQEPPPPFREIRSS